MRRMTDQEYAEQEYMPTKNYFEPDATETKQLQVEAADLHEVVDSKTSSWVERSRASSRLGEVERLIQSGRAAAKQAEVSHAANTNADVAGSPESNAKLRAHNLAMDPDRPWYFPWRSAELRAENYAKVVANRAAAVANVTKPVEANVTKPKMPEEQVFAATVPYFAAR